MKRCWFVLAFLAVFFLAGAFPVRAEMGVDIFQRSAISAIHPPLALLGLFWLSGDPPFQAGVPARAVFPIFASYPLGAIWSPVPENSLPPAFSIAATSPQISSSKNRSRRPLHLSRGPVRPPSASKTVNGPLERAYSIASSPYEPVLEFFVERVPRGKALSKLYEMKKDTELLLRRFAKGRFHTLDPPQRPKKSSAPRHRHRSRSLHQLHPHDLSGFEEGRHTMPGEHRLFYACKAPATSTNLVIAMNWKKSPPKPPG